MKSNLSTAKDNVIDALIALSNAKEELDLEQSATDRMAAALNSIEPNLLRALAGQFDCGRSCEFVPYDAPKVRFKDCTRVGICWADEAADLRILADVVEGLKKDNII